MRRKLLEAKQVGITSRRRNQSPGTMLDTASELRRRGNGKFSSSSSKQLEIVFEEQESTYKDKDRRERKKGQLRNA